MGIVYSDLVQMSSAFCVWNRKQSGAYRETIGSGIDVVVDRVYHKRVGLSSGFGRIFWLTFGIGCDIMVCVKYKKFATTQTLNSDFLFSCPKSAKTL
jgi:hypothetical protein